MGFFSEWAEITREGEWLKKVIKECDDKEICVGFNASSGTEEDGTSIVDIAAWNEFGTENIPSRPFMRDTMRNNREEINSFLASSMKRMMNGSEPEKVMNQVGSKVKGMMQKEIRDGEFEPNKPSTIAKKGSDKPLIDTGRMRQSVIYIVRQKGSGGDGSVIVEA